MLKIHLKEISRIITLHINLTCIYVRISTTKHFLAGSYHWFVGHKIPNIFRSLQKIYKTRIKKKNK